MSLKETWEEFWQGGSSKIGVAFITIVIAISIYTVVSMPLDYGTRYWSNPLYWADNPRAVPPTWINFFRSDKLLEQSKIVTNIPVKSYSSGSFFLKFYEKEYYLDRERFPNFMTLRVSRVTYLDTPPLISAYLARPDGDIIELYTFSVDGPLVSEESPYLRYAIEDKRILISGDLRLSRTLSEYVLSKYQLILTPSEIVNLGYETVLFGDLTEEGTFEPMIGTYKVGTILRGKPEDSIDVVTFIIGGEVYGFMGTDTLGRDLSQGLLFGFPIALLIGFTTSILTTIIGASLGIIGGYIGGFTDTAIQRISDIVNNIPQLPLLIFLTFILDQRSVIC